MKWKEPDVVGLDKTLSREIQTIFFRFSGLATLEIDGRCEVLQTHEGAEISLNIPHQIFNESDADVEFLVISQPASRSDRFSI